jgi:hypothetical protein
MDTLIIKEACGGLFTALLPVCDASILSKVLDPNMPWVTLIGFWTDEACTWIEQHLPPLFDASRRVESVRVKRLEMDVDLPTAEFLRLLSFFLKWGVHLVQATRPLPPTLSLGELKPDSTARVFREVGIALEFYLPHPHENAEVTSPSKEVLERVVAAFSK